MSAKFYPKLYRRAAYHSKEGFVDHIYQYEHARKNPITREEAGEKFRIIQQISNAAKRAGNHLDEIIRYDDASGQWGGAETPVKRESLGIKRTGRRGEQSANSHRWKVWKISARLKPDFLDEIMAIYGCDRDRAKSIFETCRRNELIRRHEPSNTWRGFFFVDPPEPEDWPTKPMLAQEQYGSKYGDMPPVAHDGFNHEQSAHLAWIIAREKEFGCDIDLKEAEVIRLRVWNCSRDKSLIPWRRDPETKLICGLDSDAQKAINARNAEKTMQSVREKIAAAKAKSPATPITRDAIFTDDMRAKIASIDFKTSEQLFLEAVHASTNVKPDQVWPIVDAAKEEGLWRTGTTKIKWNNNCPVWAGREIWKRQAAEALATVEPSAVAAEPSAEIERKDRPNIETVVPVLRIMPQMPGMLEAQDWIRQEIGKNIDAEWIYGQARDFNYILYGDNGPHGADLKTPVVPTIEPASAELDDQDGYYEQKRLEREDDMSRA